jgi:hypothetical protein
VHRSTTPITISTSRKMRMKRIKGDALRMEFFGMFICIFKHIVSLFPIWFVVLVFNSSSLAEHPPRCGAIKWKIVVCAKSHLFLSGFLIFLNYAFYFSYSASTVTGNDPKLLPACTEISNVPTSLIGFSRCTASSGRSICACAFTAATIAAASTAS